MAVIKRSVQESSEPQQFMSMGSMALVGGATRMAMPFEWLTNAYEVSTVQRPAQQN
jgi:hypothetical protein